ncbi:hypothetical protein OUZ56_025401 [Daphnia magna]|uniref:Secreted protein n=1 Tax=Daphnia magna TaxID=35525 RepID=A0ABQ9ZJS8_9CRUS|nr:hypothetical protein OUZ56_025401 [Daphnia magna]
MAVCVMVSLIIVIDVAHTESQLGNHWPSSIHDGAAQQAQPPPEFEIHLDDLASANSPSPPLRLFFGSRISFGAGAEEERMSAGSLAGKITAKALAD